MSQTGKRGPPVLVLKSCYWSPAVTPVPQTTAMIGSVEGHGSVGGVLGPTPTMLWKMLLGWVESPNVRAGVFASSADSNSAATMDGSPPDISTNALSDSLP